MRAATALAGAELRRLVRDRTFLFFMVLLPVLIILLIGITISSNEQVRVGVVDQQPGPLSTSLVRHLGDDPALSVEAIDSRAEAAESLRRNEVSAAVVIPEGFDAALRGGQQVTVPVLVPGAAESSQAALAAVSAVVSRHAAQVQAARFAADRGGRSFDENLAAASRLQQADPAVPLRTEVVDSASDYLPLGFSYSAPTMLVLFVFINALAGGAAMIQTRQYGILSRALAAPTRPRDLVAGEALAYLSLTVGQAVLIVAIGAFLFGVEWGNPFAAAALIFVWALVGTGAGMLSGTLFRTPEQAGAIGPAVGIAFGMLGGCMWPLEIVPPSVRALGHVTPHAWAVDAWVEVLSRGGGLPQIAGYLGILALYAVVLLALASLRLRRSLVTP
jgi:ABC-2 type transport system permease protein